MFFQLYCCKFNKINVNNKVYTQEELNNDSQLCNTDSDCRIKFSNCSCTYICTNKYITSTIDCGGACEGEDTQNFADCRCSNNKCNGYAIL